MARLPKPNREDLSPDAQKVFDKVAGPGGLRGPHAALIYVPSISERVGELGDHLRNHGALSGAERELAILATVREGEARFAWQAHEPTARREGARSEAIEAVRSKGSTGGLTPRERIIIEVVRAAHRDHAIPDALFQQALSEFGRELLVELVALSAYYGLVGVVLNSFEVDIPATAGPMF